MKELVEVSAKSLVDNPDEVGVTEKDTGKSLVLELKVASSDMGKVIGKQGRIAKAIRSVVKAAASKEDKKVFYITPTNKAEKMKREIVSLCEDKYQIFEEKMGKEDMMMFIDLIVKFNNILEELKNYKEGKKC